MGASRLRRARAGSALLATAVLLCACNEVLSNRSGRIADDADAGGAASDSGAVDASLPDARADAAVKTDAGDASSFPTMLGGSLVLWLDGDDGLFTSPCDAGACVEQWLDRSGFHNDAFPGTNGAIAPITSHDLPGHVGVRFDGSLTSLAIASTPSLEITGSFAVLAVAAEQPSTHIGGIYNKTSYTYPYAGLALWGAYANPSMPMEMGQVAAQVDINQYVRGAEANQDDRTLRLYGTLFDGKTLSVRVNGHGPSSATVYVDKGSLAATGQFAVIGGNPQSVQVFQGDIFEVMVVARTLDEAEWATALAYFAARYGLAP